MPTPGEYCSSESGGYGQPASARELPDDERNVHEQRPGSGQPESDRVEGRERDIAHAQLQRHDIVDQSDHERHGDKKDHDRAVRGKDLVVVLRRQVARRVKGDRLLRAHHEGINEASQQHQERERTVHHADPLVIDARDPFAPEIRHVAFDDHPREHGHDHQADGAPRSRAESAGRTGSPAMSTCQACHSSSIEPLGAPACVTRGASPDGSGPSPGGNFWEAIASNKFGATARYV